MEIRCSVKGCNRPFHANGLCAAHNLRRYRNGTPGKAEIAPPHPKRDGCTIPWCDKPHQALGYCGMHYMRLRSTGDPLKVHGDIVGAKRCKVDGCERPYSAKGYCKSHYNQHYIPSWEQESYEY